MITAVILSRIHFPVTTLGPGRRIGIWFQGCSIRCQGCISVDTWTQRGPAVRVDEVLELVARLAPEADGLTISGGEPFDQPAALIALLRGVRALLRSEADVLVFSGHPYEALKPVLAVAAGLIDGLVSDPFDLHMPQTLALRGSDNQRLHALTELGRARLLAYNRQRTPADAAVDVMLDADGTVWMAGIPERGDIERLRHILAVDGTQAWTTEHVSASPPIDE